MKTSEEFHKILETELKNLRSGKSTKGKAKKVASICKKHMDFIEAKIKKFKAND